jgi:hypothetical protein
MTKSESGDDAGRRVSTAEQGWVEVAVGLGRSQALMGFAEAFTDFGRALEDCGQPACGWCRPEKGATT